MLLLIGFKNIYCKYLRRLCLPLFYRFGLKRVVNLYSLLTRGLGTSQGGEKASLVSFIMRLFTMETQTVSTSQDDQKFLRALIVSGAAAGSASAVAFNSQPVAAITVADVDTAMTSIITNADTAADSALPIGAALLALAVIAMVIKRFIMAA